MNFSSPIHNCIFFIRLLYQDHSYSFNLNKCVKQYFLSQKTTKQKNQKIFRIYIFFLNLTNSILNNKTQFNSRNFNKKFLNLNQLQLIPFIIINQISFDMNLFYNFYPQLMPQYAYFDTNVIPNNVPVSIPTNFMFENYNMMIDYSSFRNSAHENKEGQSQMGIYEKLEQNQDHPYINKPIEYMEKQIPSKKLKQTDQEKSLNIQFLKKNTESNICNQILSFISLREKSQWFLTRILKNLELDQMEISVAFYNHIQKVKGNKKKYVNRRKILEISTSTLPTTSSSQFTSKLFRKLVRILIRTYLEKCCTISILTSKKMSKETCHPHLQRMRQIYKWLMNSFKNNQSE